MDLMLAANAAKAAAKPKASPDPSVPQTPYLSLNIPPTGFPSWGSDVNQNFVTLDSAVGALQNSYQGTWLPAVVYAHGQIVIWQGLVYISLADGNVNRQPDLSADVWGPMGAATSIGYPEPGVAVSTGSAWTTSIDPNTLARMEYVNPGNFSAQKSVRAYGSQGPLDISQTVAYIGTGTQGNNPNLTLLNSTGAANEKAWTVSSWPDTGAGPSMSLSVLDDAGNVTQWLTCWRHGTAVTRIAANAPLDIISNLNGGNFTAANNGLSVLWNHVSGEGATAFINNRGNVVGGFYWINAAAGATINSSTPYSMKLDNNSALHLIGPIYTPSAVIGNLWIGEGATPPGGGPSIRTTSAGHIVINPSGNSPLLLNWEGGGYGTTFGNGAQGTVANISNTGDLSFNGFFTGCSYNLAAAGGLTTLTAAGGLQIGWNFSNGAGEIDFICTGYQANTGGFSWYAAPPNTHLGVGAGAPDEAQREQRPHPDGHIPGCHHLAKHDGSGSLQQPVHQTGYRRGRAG